MQAKKYANSLGLSELQSLNRMLQEKHGGYGFMKPGLDSLDVEVASRGKEGEGSLRGFY